MMRTFSTIGPGPSQSTSNITVNSSSASTMNVQNGLNHSHATHHTPSTVPISTAQGSSMGSLSMGGPPGPGPGSLLASSHQPAEPSVNLASKDIYVTTQVHQKQGIRAKVPEKNRRFVQAAAKALPGRGLAQVAEVFLTAGHAFQKLGDLTLQLHSSVEPEECKWTEKDVDQLRDALTRFAHELDMISQSVQGRTTKHIKTDIKRRHMMSAEDPRRPQSPAHMKRATPLPPSGTAPKRINLATAPKPVPIPGRYAPPNRIVTSMHQPQQVVQAHHLDNNVHYITRSQDVGPSTF